jgi:transcriptional regulator with XRE-family HTH domain
MAKSGNRKGQKKIRENPIGSDFGTYLRILRYNKGITVEFVAEGLGLSVRTIKNIETGQQGNPNPERLKLWLKLLGESERYNEAMKFLGSVKNIRQFRYQPRNRANEHIDRLLDAYESARLTEADLYLLRMVAIGQYDKGT